MEENKIKSTKSEISGKVVQTYAEDMAKVIEDGTEGLVKKMIHGEEQHQEEKKNLSPESKKNKLFMFVGVLLIFLALTTLFYFILFKSENNTISVEKQFTPIIFHDRSTFVEILGFNKDEIKQTVLNQISATEVKNGGVEGIYLIENGKIIGLRRFISMIEGNFVPDSNIFLVHDNFLMGVVNADIKGFFILLKVRSTADIFESLRAWEGKMFFDLYKFLGIELSKETNYLLTKNFENGIVENKNSRILYDKDGEIVLMYILADDNSIIITNTQSAAHEILLRLSGSQKEQ